MARQIRCAPLPATYLHVVYRQKIMENNAEIRKEEHKQSVFVAFLDIMGYKQIVKNNTHEELKDIYFYDVSTFTAYNYLPQKVLRSGGKYKLLDEAKRINVKSLMVSDSVIVWTPDDSMQSFHDILFKVNYMLVESVLKGFPMRAGICVGPISLFVEDDVNTYTQLILLGKPIVDAYEISDKQNWIGCVIDKKCIEKYKEYEIQYSGDNLVNLDYLINNKILLKYKVPKKTGSIEEEYVPNWTLYPGSLLSKIGFLISKLISY
jgi:hypothetical protein